MSVYIIYALSDGTAERKCSMYTLEDGLHVQELGTVQLLWFEQICCVCCWRHPDRGYTNSLMLIQIKKKEWKEETSVRSVQLEYCQGVQCTNEKLACKLYLKAMVCYLVR